MGANQPVPETADVVIVGGGIMGTSVAFFLTDETDLDVVVVEKDTIAAGSTGDSSAIIRHQYGSDEQYSKMAWWSHQFYKTFKDRTGESIAHEDNPHLRFAADRTDAATTADASLKTLRSLDIPVSRIDHDEFDDRFPLFELDEYDFGVCDETAAYSDGTDVAGGFARAAQRQGAQILTGIGVSEILTDDDSVTGVHTDDGRISCEIVVVTAGPWTPRLAETVGVDLPITPTREQVISLEATEEIRDPSTTIPTTGLPDRDWYLRPDFGDGVLVATHHSGEEVNPDTYDPNPDEDMLLTLSGGLAEVVPALSTAGIRGQYCGIYSTTPDKDFIIDQVGPSGCIVGCGFSGHGFKQAPAVGRILTDLVVDGETDFVDMDMFSLDRFDRSHATET